MRKLILHVGLHKTGSSAIQVSCNNNRSQLKNAGYYYPTFGNTAWTNHSVPLSLLFMRNSTSNHTVEELFPRDSDRQEAALKIKLNLIDEINYFSNLDVIFSGEDVSVFQESDLFELKFFVEKILGINKILVIIYVRNPASFNISNAQEWVRSGKKTLGSILELGNLMQAKLKVEKFSKVFGTDSITVCDFNEAVSSYEDISNHFYKLININVNEEFTFQKVNESMPLEKILVVSSLIRLAPNYAKQCLNSITNDGTRFTPTNYYASRAFKCAREDVEFLSNKYSINYYLSNFPESLGLNPSILLRNCHKAIQIAAINNVENMISWEKLFESMYVDIEQWFPNLGVQLSIIGYNCTGSVVIKQRVDSYIRNNQINGCYFRNLFIDDESNLLIDKFNAIEYLRLNPDVADSGIDPFQHYFAFGKFMGRKYN